mmetsp:Transcript_83780/g.260336  ORF Transcript_83780/g.260336 Transcript_83780/m.260336 type:complete len:266 (+) Transcript_83780:1628-2425(+)
MDAVRTCRSLATLLWTVGATAIDAKLSAVLEPVRAVCGMIRVPLDKVDPQLVHALLFFVIRRPPYPGAAVAQVHAIIFELVPHICTPISGANSHAVNLGVAGGSHWAVAHVREDAVLLGRVEASVLVVVGHLEEPAAVLLVDVLPRIQHGSDLPTDAFCEVGEEDREVGGQWGGLELPVQLEAVAMALPDVVEQDAACMVALRAPLCLVALVRGVYELAVIGRLGVDDLRPAPLAVVVVPPSCKQDAPLRENAGVHRPHVDERPV